MVPSIRPLTTFLLSFTLLLGHAPAWLHVATCDHGASGHAGCDHGHSACQHNGNVHECCADDHGCHSQACEETASSACSQDSLANATEFEGESHSPHDSHSCWICQSLAAPGGFVDQDQASITCEWIEFAAWPTCLSADVDPSISWPPLRGPPAIRV
ncbi:hypothetical protein CEE69_12750 [Rhodopirellula bahusiensis]|uniref:Uncharacterized protein n=1 Tax=Rhodopirellula bahusiensis TaxID=2014065 RepID=A0A2G1W7Y8_9BACT|nr:hypothetical protein CEE69_12750 [Rhodopirellula bahusiensis]